MTSEERRAARRQRRSIAREQKRKEAVGQYDDYERVIKSSSLIKAAKQSRKEVAWKSSVQKYFMSLLRNTLDLRKKLQSGVSVVMGFICFYISERGKTRYPDDNWHSYFENGKVEECNAIITYEQPVEIRWDKEVF